jgi:ATP-binding cassette, subfamily C, bacterial
LDTVVGRQGMKLSGGQRQRLAIARMMVANPSVVILDEATSALDSETEYKLHHALNDFLKDRTTIIVAHRLSAVKQAEHVYVLKRDKFVSKASMKRFDSAKRAVCQALRTVSVRDLLF